MTCTRTDAADWFLFLLSRLHQNMFLNVTTLIRLPYHVCSYRRTDSYRPETCLTAAQWLQQPQACRFRALDIYGNKGFHISSRVQSGLFTGTGFFFFFRNKNVLQVVQNKWIQTQTHVVLAGSWPTVQEQFFKSAKLNPRPSILFLL